MTIKRMDNALIVVDDLDAVKAFFIELGLTFEGESTVASCSPSRTTTRPLRPCAWRSLRAREAPWERRLAP